MHISDCYNFFKFLALLGLLSFLALPAEGIEETVKKGPKEELRTAQAAFEKGEWDAAERAYLKALRTSRVEERIPAYEGLAALYRKLKHLRKAERIELRLKSDQEFRAKLAPRWDSYYRTYIVKQGDTYSKLATSQGTSLEWLLRANDKQMLRPGKTIRIPKIPYAIEVNKTSRTLTWRRGSEVLKVYSIAVGKTESETPEGEFKIASKVKDPIWYHMKKEFPSSSPENLLGTRWLGLDQKGYGIHGTTLPGTIGAKASHGCVRMHNYEVEELFDWIPIGTKVTIS